MPNLDKDQEDKIVIEIHHYHHYPEKKSQSTRRPGIVYSNGQSVDPPPPPPSTLHPRYVREGCAIYLLIGITGLIGAVLTLI